MAEETARKKLELDLTKPLDHPDNLEIARRKHWRYDADFCCYFDRHGLQVHPDVNAVECLK